GTGRAECGRGGGDRRRRRRCRPGGTGRPAAAVRDRRRGQEPGMADAGQGRRAQAVVAGRRRPGGDLLMGLLRRKAAVPRSEGERTVFFASDLHVSEVRFKKIAAAAKFYGADILLRRRHISDKLAVPLVSTG